MAAPPPNANEALSPLAPATLARFRADLAACGVDVGADRVLVAVSGGPDSVALLLLAHAALDGRCHAATVDHGLRAASGEEAAFVGRLCATLGVDHAVLTGALPDRVGRTANLSARARLLRYRLLQNYAEANGAWLATAHHADDQLETLVMRLNRGAGLAGLSGIRPASGRIVRPLLEWRRAELAALVAAAGIAPVDDPSNADDRFDRARLRKELARAAWLDAGRAAQSAKALRDAEDALDWTARRLEGERCAFAEGQATLDVAGLPFELLRRLALACIRHVDPAADPHGPALVRFCDLLANGGQAMIGGVLATVLNGDGRDVLWRFTEAPPRRVH